MIKPNRDESLALAATFIVFSCASQQKVFVMPNMDDLYLPLMTPGQDNSPASQRSSVRSSSHQSSGESQENLSEWARSEATNIQ